MIISALEIGKPSPKTKCDRGPDGNRGTVETKSNRTLTDEHVAGQRELL